MEELATGMGIMAGHLPVLNGEVPGKNSRQVKFSGKCSIGSENLMFAQN
jgi:hypothetical protein